MIFKVIVMLVLFLCGSVAFQSALAAGLDGFPRYGILRGLAGTATAWGLMLALAWSI